jgi:hypothetical protein
VFNKETEQLVGKKLRMAMNFLKHADSDPGAKLTFAPVVNELFLIDAVQMYGKLYVSLSPLMNTFRAWFMVMRGRHVHRPEEVEVFLPEGATTDDLSRLNRREFMEKVLPLFATEDGAE